MTELNSQIETLKIKNISTSDIFDFLYDLGYQLAVPNSMIRPIRGKNHPIYRSGLQHGETT
jgi:hypothetical protein